MKGRQKRSQDNRVFMRELREHLQESKQLIRDLREFRKEVFLDSKKDKEQLKEIREKAIDAINDLFRDEVGETGT